MFNIILTNDCTCVVMFLNWYTALVFLFVCLLYSVDANVVRRHASDRSRWNGGMTRRASITSLHAKYVDESIGVLSTVRASASISSVLLGVLSASDRFVECLKSI